MRSELSDYETPMACRSISLSRRVRRMTIGCVRLSSAPCFHKRCCSRIADTMQTGLLARQQGPWANIPPKRNRKDPICFSPYLYRARNLIERFFNKIKQCRRVATRYDKPAANYLAFIKLASMRIWLRASESAP
jgi:transposase